MDKTALRAMSYGVYVVTSLDGDRPVGCVANSAIQVTSRPATVAVSINHDNFTNGCIAQRGEFALSVLSEGSDPAIIGTFGYKSSADVDKFEGVEHEVVAGVPVVRDAVGALVCKVVATMESETHTVFLGEVVETASFDAGAPPMTYRYYHEVLKGRAPRNAPTYSGPDESQPPQEPEAAREGGPAAKRWRCLLCGHVFEGDEPPAGCPMCGAGPEMFVPVEE